MPATHSEHTPKIAEENPFKQLGFFRFWMVSTLFYIAFPISLLLAWLLLGKQSTQQLIQALWADFLQTLFFAALTVAALIWLLYHYASKLFT